MNASDILTLARAGFTAQQIAALAAAPAPAQSGTPAQAPAADPMQQLLAQMGALTQAVQANAILAAGQPKQETADDILAQIIAPPLPKANDK